MTLYSSTICFGLVLVMFCQPEKPIVVSDLCATAKIIVASRRDTPETLRQVRTANAKIRRLCPSK